MSETRDPEAQRATVASRAPRTLTDTLVIIPTYNEIGALAEVVARVHQAVAHTDILIIDDGSTDGTAELAAQLATRNGIELMQRGQKLGLGTAYLAGFEYALAHDYRWCVEMDGDGSHLPEQLPSLLAAAHSGAGLVVGTRWITGGAVEGWPRYRRFISRTGTRIAQLSLRSRLRDITSGFRVFDTQWLARLDFDRIDSQGYGFQVEVAWTLERLGCPVSEVPITFVERSAGRSKMSLSIVGEALRRVLVWGWWLRWAPGRLPRERWNASSEDGAVERKR